MNNPAQLLADTTAHLLDNYRRTISGVPVRDVEESIAVVASALAAFRAQQQDHTEQALGMVGEWKLPEPDFLLHWRDSRGVYTVNKPGIDSAECFTADQVHAAHAAGRQEGRRQSRDVCKALQGNAGPLTERHYAACADAILTLAYTSAHKGGGEPG